MYRGKSICNTLKAIRKKIADANGISYSPVECHHEGDCLGTCPACEAEVRYIEKELNLRRMAGRAVTIVGLSAGMIALTACGDDGRRKGDKLSGAMNLSVSEKMKSPSSAEDCAQDSMPEWEILGEVPQNTDRKKGTKVVEKFIVPTAKNTDKENGKDLKAVKNTTNVVKKTGEVSGQKFEMTDDKMVFGEVAETQPSFPGGTDALKNYIKENLKYPVDGTTCAQGRVILTFFVEEDGSITEVKVVRGIVPELDKEAVRVVRNMPKWSPGRLQGQPVRTRYTLPVVFRQD